jgi:hypothetical protein
MVIGVGRARIIAYASLRPRLARTATALDKRRIESRLRLNTEPAHIERAENDTALSPPISKQRGPTNR